MSLDSELKRYFSENRKQILTDYYRFLQFASIAADPHYDKETLLCSDWLKIYLEDAGLTVEKWDTPQHPVLFAESVSSSGAPTVMIYGHYDVQPADPLEQWDSPPFEPIEKDGVIYARGAQDNKGQSFYVIQAIKALLSIKKQLPVTIKLLIEGDEETGSYGLSEILNQKKERLKSDYLVIADVGLLDANTPTVTLGVRGIITLDVIVKGSNEDLHSGFHGGLVYNPIHALAEILASLRDKNGKITVPGFYDNVEELDDKEKELLSLSFDQERYENVFGTTVSGGEIEFSARERNWIRPTLEVNGISGGYTGEGFKTVIPAEARAKLSCRLVPDQDPEEIAKKVKHYIRTIAPKGVEVTVAIRGGWGKAARARADSPIASAYSKAYERVFEKPTSYIFEGGSIPIAKELAEAASAEVVLVGMGLAEDAIHAPNEHFSLDRFEKGYMVNALALDILGGY